MRTTRLLTLITPVVLVLAACSGSGTATPSASAPSAPSVTASATPSTTPSAETGTAVSIEGFSFTPAVLTVPVGTTVTWTNGDSARHTVAADDGSLTSDTLATGATFSHTFAAAGTFAYHCSIHPSMTGVVTVE